MGGKITKVIPGLYIGDNSHASCDQDLLGAQISDILSIQSFPRDQTLNTSINILEVVISPSDQCGLLKQLTKTNDFIHTVRNQQQRVMICRCSAIEVIQAVIHAAYPSTSLQFQLDAYGDVPEADAFWYRLNADQSPRNDVPTAKKERQRLVDKFGPYADLTNDMEHIEQAIAYQKSLIASGAILQYPQPKLDWDEDDLPLTVNFPSRSRHNSHVGHQHDDLPSNNGEQGVESGSESDVSPPSTPPFIPTGDVDQDLFPDDPSHLLTQDVSRMQIHVPRSVTPEPIELNFSPKDLLAKPDDESSDDRSSPLLPSNLLPKSRDKTGPSQTNPSDSIVIEGGIQDFIDDDHNQ